MLLPCEIQGAQHTTNCCLKLLTSQLWPHKVVLFCFPLRGSTVYKTSMIWCSYQTAVSQHCPTIISPRDPMGAKNEKKTYYKTYVHFIIIRAKI